MKIIGKMIRKFKAKLAARKRMKDAKKRDPHTYD